MGCAVALFLLQSATLPQADQLYARGDFQGAATSYRELLHANPRSAILLAKLGASEYALGDAAQAAGHLTQALALDAQLHPARLALGGALLDLGKPAEAIKQLKRAAAQVPGHLETQRLLGRAYQEANQFFDGERTLRAVLKQDPADWRSWTSLGVLLYNNNYYAAALEALQTGLKVQGENPRARMLEASSLVHLGRHGEAGKIFESLLADPRLESEPELLLGYAQFLVDSGSPELALPPIDRAISAAPGEPKLHFWRARILMVLDQPGPAAEAARRAIELSPEQANSRVLLLRIARKLGLQAEMAAQAKWLREHEQQ